MPEQTAHDEAPQYTARVRHDSITQAWTADDTSSTVLSSFISALGGLRAAPRPRTPGMGFRDSQGGLPRPVSFFIRLLLI